MSIVVLGMEMPNSCSECDLCYDLIYCNPLEIAFYRDDSVSKNFNISIDRLPNCPLRSLPKKHGRLIDADDIGLHEATKLAYEEYKQLEGEPYEEWYEGYYHSMYDAVNMLVCSPTIIEAEE